MSEKFSHRINEYHVSKHLGLKNKAEFMAVLDQPSKPELEKDQDFTIRTFQAMIQLAKFTEDEKLIQTTKDSCWEQICARAEFERSGWWVSTFGWFIPLALWQANPQGWGPTASFLARIGYTFTVGPAMFKAQNHVGLADEKLAATFKTILENENVRDFIPPEMLPEITPEPANFKPLCRSRSIQANWGIAPEMGILAASAVTAKELKNLITPATAAVILTGFKLFIWQMAKYKPQKIKELMSSVRFQDTMKWIGRELNKFPWLPAGTAIAVTTDLAATEVMAAVRELEKPDDDAVFNGFNRNLITALTERQRGIKYDFQSQLLEILHQDVPNYESFIAPLLQNIASQSLPADVKNALLEISLETAQHVVKSVRLLKTQKEELEAKQKTVAALTSEIDQLQQNIKRADQKNNTVDAQILDFEQQLDTQVAPGIAGNLLIDAYRPLIGLWKKRGEELKTKHQTDPDNWTEQDRYEAIAIKQQVNNFLSQIDRQGATLSAQTELSVL